MLTWRRNLRVDDRPRPSAIPRLTGLVPPETTLTQCFARETQLNRESPHTYLCAASATSSIRNAWPSTTCSRNDASLKKETRREGRRVSQSASRIPAKVPKDAAEKAYAHNVARASRGKTSLVAGPYLQPDSARLGQRDPPSLTDSARVWDSDQHATGEKNTPSTYGWLSTIVGCVQEKARRFGPWRA